MGLAKLTEPRNVGELALIQSLLDGNDIRYVIQHEHVSSLYPGVPFMACAVMVSDTEIERASMLISKLRASEEGDSAGSA